MLAVAVARYARNPRLLAATRPAHHAYARRLRAEGSLLAAGPFADGTGAIFVYEAESLDAVRRLVDDDPFQSCGVFAEVEIKAWTLYTFAPDALAQRVTPPLEA